MNESKFTDTKGAYVVLDSNSNNNFRVVFNERPEIISPEFEGRRMTYVTIKDGIASYGLYESDGKWWSSRASVINVKHNVNIVDITGIINGSSYAMAITKEFAEYLLEKYELPFHLENESHDMHERRWLFVQNDSTSLIDTVVTDNKGHDCTILEHMIQYGVETFKVKYPNGDIRYLTFKHLSCIYKGLDWETYSRELIKINEEEGSL